MGSPTDSMEEGLSYIVGEDAPKDLPSLTQSFLAAVRKYPENLALSSLNQPPDLYGFQSQPSTEEPNEWNDKPWLRWTYSTLLEASRRLGSALKSRGVPAGSPVITFLPNGVESWMCLWACHLSGYTWAPFNPNNLKNRSEISYMVETVLEHCKTEDPKVVLVAGDVEIAKKLDGLRIFENTLKIVASATNDDQTDHLWNWIPMEAFLAKECQVIDQTSSTTELHLQHQRPPSEGDEQVIFFTSGSTSMPKGCVWFHPRSTLAVHRVLNLSSRNEVLDELTKNQGGGRIYVPLPNNHVAAYVCVLPWINHGGAIVIQGGAGRWSSSTAQGSFDPEVLLKNLQLERCTDVLIVPTIIQTIAAANKTLKIDLSGLSITMAGSPAASTHVATCFNDLGIARVVNCWGMSECIQNLPLPCWREQWLKGAYESSCTQQSLNLSAGTAAMTQRVKVCKPGTTKPVPFAESGELHMSSPTLIQQYIGSKASNDDFYTDDEGWKWFNTGDEANVTRNRQIFITGRHKEVIIRGGENISPIAIETALSRVRELVGVEVIIVGVPNDIAGEVPVAVYKQKDVPDHKVFGLIHETVLKEMGPMYVPTELISLKTLGLDDWPKTAIGKHQRIHVTAAVRKYVTGREAQTRPRKRAATESTDDLKRRIDQVWSATIGISPERLPFQESFKTFTDSITLMQVRAAILRDTGFSLTLAEMSLAGTIARHSEMLLAKASRSDSESASVNERPSKRRRTSPADLNAIINAEQRQLIEESLKDLGLQAEDCENIITPSDANEILSRTLDFNGWSASIVFTVPTSNDLGHLEDSIRRLFTLHPLLVSHFARTGPKEAFHVLLKQEDRVLDNFVYKRGSLRSMSELKAVPRAYPAVQGPAAVPGLVTHVEMFKIEEENCVAAVLTVNHIVMDATYMQAILKDLDSILGGGRNLGHYVGYDVWAQKFHTRRNSPQAKAITDWHVGQLQDLHLYNDIMWPLPTSDRAAVHQQIFEHKSKQPEIASFRKQNPDITPSTIFKTAMMLALADTTGSMTALFSSCEAARATMPFAPISGGDEHQEAADVAGPTYTVVFEVNKMRSESTILQLLEETQKKQHELSRNATACWRDIHARLITEGGSNGEKIIASLEQFAFALCFNWVPGMGDVESQRVETKDQLDVKPKTYQNLNCFETYFSSVGGLEIDCNLTGAGLDEALIYLSGTGIDVHEMELFAKKMDLVLTFICQRGNANMSVEKVLGVVAGRHSPIFKADLVMPENKAMPIKV